MKTNWNKERDKFNKKLDNIFFVIHLKKIYIYIEIEIKNIILFIFLLDLKKKYNK
jgi:hypothetical protein